MRRCPTCSDRGRFSVSAPLIATRLAMVPGSVSSMSLQHRQGATRQSHLRCSRLRHVCIDKVNIPLAVILFCPCPFGAGNANRCALASKPSEHLGDQRTHPPSMISSMASSTRSRFSSTVFFSTAPLQTGTASADGLAAALPGKLSLVGTLNGASARKVCQGLCRALVQGTV